MTAEIAEEQPQQQQSVGEKILKQIEFYFSDANLSRDKFMQEKLANDADKYVDLSVLALFPRVKSLSEDLEAIKEALSNSDILEFNEEKTKIRRKTPFDKESYEAVRDGKTVFVKGLPKTASLDDLISFFNSLDENVKVALIRRKMNENSFTGMAYLEFESQKDAELFKSFDKSKFEFEGEPFELGELKPKRDKKNEKQKEKLTENKEDQLEKKEEFFKSVCKLTLVPLTADGEVKNDEAVESKEEHPEAPEAPTAEVEESVETKEAEVSSESKVAEEAEKTAKRKQDIQLRHQIKKLLQEKVGNVFVDQLDDGTHTVRFREYDTETALQKLSGDQLIVVDSKYQLEFSELSPEQSEKLFEQAKSFLDSVSSKKRGRPERNTRYNRSNKKQRSRT